MSPWGHRAARAREVISNVCRTRRKAKIDQAEEAEKEDEEEETTVVAVVIETPVAEVAGIVATANVLVVETTVVAVTTETAEATTAAVTTAEAEAMAVTTAAVMTGDVAVMTAAETIGAGMVAGMVAAMAAVIAAVMGVVMGAVMGAVAVIAGIVVIDQEVSERVAAEKAERADQNHPKNSFHSPKAWKPQNTVKGVRKLWVFMARLQQKLCSQEPNVFVVSCRQTFRR